MGRTWLFVACIVALLGFGYVAYAQEKAQVTGDARFIVVYSEIWADGLQMILRRDVRVATNAPCIAIIKESGNVVSVVALAPSVCVN